MLKIFIEYMYSIINEYTGRQSQRDNTADFIICTIVSLFWFSIWLLLGIIIYRLHGPKFAYYMLYICLLLAVILFNFLCPFFGDIKKFTLSVGNNNQFKTYFSLVWCVLATEMLSFFPWLMVWTFEREFLLALSSVVLSGFVVIGTEYVRGAGIIREVGKMSFWLFASFFSFIVTIFSVILFTIGYKKLQNILWEYIDHATQYINNANNSAMAIYINFIIIFIISLVVICHYFLFVKLNIKSVNNGINIKIVEYLLPIIVTGPLAFVIVCEQVYRGKIIDAVNISFIWTNYFWGRFYLQFYIQFCQKISKIFFRYLCDIFVRIFIIVFISYNLSSLLLPFHIDQYLIGLLNISLILLLFIPLLVWVSVITYQVIIHIFQDLSTRRIHILYGICCTMFITIVVKIVLMLGEKML
ncbi:hypothetical protein [Leuconostoc pseudomesenteroides]|uniref:hypothetical protein n=1 Tax=Leuconostoc pseudomesenteroides TaxID=33968 RepID=UPI00345E2C7C